MILALPAFRCFHLSILKLPGSLSTLLVLFHLYCLFFGPGVFDALLFISVSFPSVFFIKTLTLHPAAFGSSIYTGK